MEKQQLQGQGSMLQTPLRHGTCIWQVVVPDMHNPHVHSRHAAQAEGNAALCLDLMGLPIYCTNHPLSLQSRAMHLVGYQFGFALESGLMQSTFRSATQGPLHPETASGRVFVWAGKTASL